MRPLPGLPGFFFCVVLQLGYIYDEVTPILIIRMPVWFVPY